MSLGPAVGHQRIVAVAVGVGKPNRSERYCRLSGMCVGPVPLKTLPTNNNPLFFRPPNRRKTCVSIERSHGDEYRRYEDHKGQ
jgi:hypothetical protein